jgi:hypothetical protein
MTKKVLCRSCGELYDYRRRQLGYNFCLDCGDFLAREERLGWCIVPLPKQGYTIVNDKHELKQLNQKPRA